MDFSACHGFLGELAVGPFSSHFVQSWLTLYFLLALFDELSALGQFGLRFAWRVV